MHLPLEQNKSMVNVEVAYALPEKQVIIALQMAIGSTVREAIEQSAVDNNFPQSQQHEWVVGIFGRKTSLDTRVSEGDRIEIYRPLQQDPKLRRRTRAQQLKSQPSER